MATYTVSLTLSIEAETPKEAETEFLDHLYNGDFDEASIGVIKETD